MSCERWAVFHLSLCACALLTLPVCSEGGSGGGGGGAVAAANPCAADEPPNTNGRRYRAIAGVSMGAYGALNLGTKHADLFGTIGAMGGPVDLRQLLVDIRDDNLDVKPHPGAPTPLPMEVGDDFTFDLLPPYPDRQTRIGFTKDLILAFGNPLLHHPDPDFAFLASDSEPAAKLMDDEWGAFTIPTDPRGFLDGGDDNEDGLRQVGAENATFDASDALLVASGTLSSAFGIDDGTDIGGRMLKDEDGDGIYEIGDGIVVNLHEPFADANANGRFDGGEPFDDYGLDGVDGTGDFGEGNGAFDEDPDIATWLSEDPLTRISARSADALCDQRIYMDAGNRDELNFLRHHQNVVDELTGKGLPVAVVVDDDDDDCAAIPDVAQQFTFVKYQGGHVGFDTDDLLDHLQNADVCGATVIWQRLIHLLVAMDAAFPDPVRGGAALGFTTTQRIPSPALDSGAGPPERTVVIYHPPASLDPEQRLPIVYFLVGHGQEPEDYARIDALMSVLISSGIVQNLFIAFLPGEGGTDGSFYVNHAVSEAQVPAPPTIPVTSGRYEDSIVQDLIPAIEQDVLAGQLRSGVGEDGEPNGGVAPGVTGTTANTETLEWIWTLEGVPFPGRIDGGQWTDYYFSSAAGGDWSEGNDANDGLSPQTAKETLAEARTICFGGAYRRCNFDQGDVWTLTDGWGDGIGFGSIEDADVALGSCPTALEAALEQPCFWLRSSPGGRATFDGTLSDTVDDFFAFRTETRTHVLIERIDIISNASPASLLSKSPVDSYGASIVTIVASDLTNGYDGAGSNNVIAAHDVSVAHVYGNSMLAHTGANTSINASVGLNGCGAFALHSTNTILASNSGSPVVGFSQGGGDVPAALESECSVSWGEMLVTGAHFQGQPQATGNLIVGGPGDGPADDNPNQVRGTFISTFQDSAISGGGAQAVVSVRPLIGAGPGRIFYRFLYPTFRATGGSAWSINLSDDTMSSDDLVSWHVAGALFMFAGGTANQNRVVRIVDEDWVQSASTLRIVDSIYDGSVNQWNLETAQGDCLAGDPEALQSCFDALGSPLPSAVVAVGGLNNDQTVPDLAGATATGATAGSLEDSGAGWPTDAWANAIVRVTSGAGAPQSRLVFGNDTDTLFVTPAWDVIPDATSVFSVEHYGSEDGSCPDHLGADCVGQLTERTGTEGDYQAVFFPRLQPPSFMTGVRLTGFQGSPTTHPDAGRIAPGS